MDSHWGGKKVVFPMPARHLIILEGFRSPTRCWGWLGNQRSGSPYRMNDKGQHQQFFATQSNVQQDQETLTQYRTHH